MSESFDAEEFTRNETAEIKSIIGSEKVVLACSGGLCSNVMATIIQRGTGGSNISSVLIDTGFMRKNEVDSVRDTLSRAPLKLDLKVLDAKKVFMKNVEKAELPEEKRRVFYETFYSLLRDYAEEEQAKLVFLGTSATVKSMGQQHVEMQGSVKSRRGHALQVIEPLGSLNRQQVSKVAEKLGLPPRLSDLNPFPAPGLMIRMLGKVSDEKLKQVRDATEIVEEEFQYIKPSQYFVVIMENKNDDEAKLDKLRERVADYLDVGSSQVDLMVPRNRVAGLRDGKRGYMKASATRVTLLGSKDMLEPDYEDLVAYSAEFAERHKEFARCLYSVSKKTKNEKYVAVIRAVTTEDFTKADPVKLDWNKLYTLSERIMSKCGKVSSVYYDYTPKPPATIEFE